jgi:lipopolysaccharide/colanic/teichoic acid biosynthesis glycosyltransferase
MAQSLPLSSTRQLTSPISLVAHLKVLFQNLGTLIILLLVMPINAAVVLVSLLWSPLSRLFRSQQAVAAHGKNILISGGKFPCFC